MRPITPPNRINVLPDTFTPDLEGLEQWLEDGCPEGVAGMRDNVRFLLDSHKKHDARVTDLIRANSRTLIARRVETARLKIALGALQMAAAKFREYGRIHRAKGTEEGDAKAWNNDQMASEMEHAMLVEINPDDYGRA